MATYRKLLKNRKGDTIIPIVGLGEYSTTEVDTGKKWIDGKTVYRRVFTGTCSNTANTRANVTLWSASPVDTILSIGGQVQYNTDAKAYNTLPFGSDGASEFRYVYKQGGTGNINLAILSGTALTARKYVVIMEYTRS